jgi:hypothetical protein
MVRADLKYSIILICALVLLITCKQFSTVNRSLRARDCRLRGEPCFIGRESCNVLMGSSPMNNADQPI